LPRAPPPALGRLSLSLSLSLSLALGSLSLTLSLARAVSLSSWERALELALHHQTHVDTVLGMRSRYMAGMGRQEEEGSPFLKVCVVARVRRRRALDVDYYDLAVHYTACA
jgi:hypothetical protein